MSTVSQAFTRLEALLALRGTTLDRDGKHGLFDEYAVYREGKFVSHALVQHLTDPRGEPSGYTIFIESESMEIDDDVEMLAFGLAAKVPA